jgi:hypothetical protein
LETSRVCSQRQKQKQFHLHRGDEAILHVFGTRCQWVSMFIRRRSSVGIQDGTPCDTNPIGSWRQCRRSGGN